MTEGIAYAFSINSINVLYHWLDHRGGFAIGIFLLKLLIVPALLIILAVWLFSRHDRSDRYDRRRPRHPYRDRDSSRPRKMQRM